MAPGERTKEVRHVGKAVPLALALVLALSAVAFADTTIDSGDVAIVGAASASPGLALERGGPGGAFTLTVTADDGNISISQCDGIKNKVTVPTSFTITSAGLIPGPSTTSQVFPCHKYSGSGGFTETLTFSGLTVSATTTAPLGSVEYPITFGASSMVTVGEQIILDGGFVAPRIHLTISDPTPTNEPPVADAGGPYSGVEGDWVAIDGSASSDPDGDLLTYEWRYTVVTADPGTTCQFDNDEAAATTVSCTDDGTFTLTLEVSDGSLSDDDSATLTLTNAAPAFETGNPAFASASVSCSYRTVTVNFAFTDAGSNDTHSGSIDFGDGTGSRALTPAEIAAGMASHTYNSGGPYTAHVTITDDDGGSTGSTSSANTLIVQYNLSDILQPINNTRMGQAASLFKYGSTIPVKVVVTDCDGAVPTNLTLKVTWRQGLNSTPIGVEEVVPTSQPDLGNTMRNSDGQYVLQLNSRNTTADSTSGVTIWATIQETGQNTWANIGFRK